MFKTWILALIFFLVCGVTKTTPIQATSYTFETPVSLTVNGHVIKTDSPAYLEKGYTMVPIRAVSDALCAESVVWNPKNSTATITKGDTALQITKSSNIAWVNSKKVTLEKAAVIRNNRFYVPIRFVAETFGTKVNWDGTTHTVSITAPNVTVPPHLIENRDYTEEDIYWLSRIVHAESSGEPMTGKIGVANVVLNRVDSPEFDDTVYEVVFDRKYGVQFTPTANGAIYNTPSADSITAAKRALAGEKTVGNSLYFLNPSISTNFWIVNNRTFYKSIGNHDFYV